jgi:hypothetical protein
MQSRNNLLGERKVLKEAKDTLERLNGCARREVSGPEYAPFALTA